MASIPIISTSQLRPFLSSLLLAQSPKTISPFPFRRYYRFLFFKIQYDNVTAMEKIIYLHRHPFIKNLLLVACPDLVPGTEVNEFSHH